MAGFGLVGFGLVGLIVLSAGSAVAAEAMVPAGAAIVDRVKAEGVQIYDCRAAAGGGDAWVFREPLATLVRDGVTVGRHFAGPMWEMADGSSVKGRVVTQAAGAGSGDIPWLRLAVVAHGGSGALDGVTGVARVETQGGVFSGACATVGTFHLEPYSAEYVFFSGE